VLGCTAPWEDCANDSAQATQAAAQKADEGQGPAKPPPPQTDPNGTIWHYKQWTDPNSGDANAGSGNSKTTTAITGKGATGAGTETTGVNLNLYKSTDRQRISATKTQFPGVFYAVGSHGTSTQIQLPDGSFITAKDFAKMLLTDPALNYSKGTAIWLIGCETGAPIKGGQNFAQQLAAELQVHVMAPNTITWMDRGDGSVSVYYPKDRYANPMVEDKSRPGAWITY